MLEIAVPIQGLSELVTGLRDFTSQADQFIQDTLLESAKVNIVVVAKALAPKRTGALRASIEAVPVGDPLTVDLIAERPYAKFLEFGTRYIPEGKFTFLRPAIQEGIEKVVLDLQNAILDKLM